MPNKLKEGGRPMLAVAIIEDSAQDRAALDRHIRRYQRETGQEIQIKAFDRAETFLENYKAVYDVIFMDIMLPGMDGMKAAERLRRLDGEVALIFATDMRQYALGGYKVGALDYFVKPVEYYDVKLRLDRIALLKESAAPAIVIHLPGTGDVALSSREVYYIEVMDKELTYHTGQGAYRCRSVGLKKLEEELAPCGFCRCSSSFLVNLRWCRELREAEVNVAGDLLPVSRGMKQKFVTRLSEHMARSLMGGAGRMGV